MAGLVAGCSGGDDEAATPPAEAPAVTDPVVTDPTEVAPATDPVVTAPTVLPTSATTPATDSVAVGTLPPTELRTFQVDLIDPSRQTAAAAGTPGAPDRTLETTVYLPATSEPAPLIVLAHGHSGHPDKFTDLATYWSDAGYLVAVPRFPLSNDRVPEPYVGDIAEQGRDISFVIDEMLAASASDDERLADRIDPERIGLFGLSLGSLTMWSTMFNDCCEADRIDAVIQSDGAFPLPAERLSEITYPVMIAHSDMDPFFGYDTIRSEFEALPKPAFLLTMFGARHAAVGENTVTPADETFRQATTVFWDRYLGGRTDTEFPATVRIEGVTRFEATP